MKVFSITIKSRTKYQIFAFCLKGQGMLSADIPLVEKFVTKAFSNFQDFFIFEDSYIFS